MKKKALFGITLTTIITVLTLLSCEKKENLIPEKEKIAKVANVEVEQLKNYLSKLFMEDIKNITYDVKKEKFILSGKQEFTKQEIEKLYREFPILNFKDGKNIN